MRERVQIEIAVVVVVVVAVWFFIRTFFILSPWRNRDKGHRGHHLTEYAMTPWHIPECSHAIGITK